MPDEKDKPKMDSPVVAFFDPDFIAHHFAEPNAMEDAVMTERRAAWILSRLENEFSAEYWKFMAWKLKAIHNWPIERILQYLQDKRIDAGRDAVLTAIRKVASRLQEVGKDEGGAT